jgi:selenocysteine lyase/cysteine desulfurase
VDNYSLDKIRQDIIGNNVIFKSPFGKRHLLYVDYTASGRGINSIEQKIQNILRLYANTHTEDDYSGKYLTTLVHQAEKRIKELVNAGKNGKIIMVGSGATGALKRLQEIIGVYIPPYTKERIYTAIDKCSESETKDILESLDNCRPVVFIGPYEHHSNELMWREAFVELVVINLDKSGMIDKQDLITKLSDEKYKNRQKICSFSAGSNVTGIQTKIYDIAKICHQHNSLVFFDFAAVAPYIKIDMNKDEESYFDAIFFSPHKFLGGPGTCGVLIFNEKIYRNDLPPTTAGGGTVVYVGFTHHDYDSDIETREKAGTPPILQMIKVALVLELKEKIGIRLIEEIEKNYTKYFFNKLKKIDNIELLGSNSINNRLPIISFNIIHNDRILHPKFVSKLLNDLFGIQSRAGCSCAGPYGHILLNISLDTSLKYRDLILKGYEGMKPGWVRINIHYTLSQEDIDYIIETINFIAQYGYLFLRNYKINMKSGEWSYTGWKENINDFSFEDDYKYEKILIPDLPALRKSYFAQAESLVSDLIKNKKICFEKDDAEIEDLKYFYCNRKD